MSDGSRKIRASFPPAQAGKLATHQPASERRRLSLLYIPGFHTDESLQDQYCRMLWYVRPLLEEVHTIRIATSFAPSLEFDIPRYADPTLVSLAQDFYGRVERFNDADLTAWKQYLAEADILLYWDVKASAASTKLGALIKKAIAKKPSYHIDRLQYRHEGSRYISLSHDNNPSSEHDLQASREKFASMTADIGQHRKGYVFGTGPSLGQVLEMDLSDGVSIACNSMVKNGPLLEHLQPKIITIADPIFHAGFSSYAGAFRRYLYTALDRYGSYLIVPFRDYKLYMQHLPERFQDRLIGIPLLTKEEPNLDLRQAFHVTSTKNVLTLMLLPVACTLFKEVGIAGCDGRKLEENTYFWTHHQESQIHEEMEEIKKAHPSFFAIDYNDYYLEHLSTLEKWLVAGEARGISFPNLTPSHIPCLNSRSIALPIQHAVSSLSSAQTKNGTGAANAEHVFISIAQDVKDNFGHFLHYEAMLWQAFNRAGIPMISLGNKQAGQLQKEFEFLIPCFTDSSYEVRQERPEAARNRERFIHELEAAHRKLVGRFPSGTKLDYFTYLGSVSTLGEVLPFAKRFPEVHFHINLFWLLVERWPLRKPLRDRLFALSQQVTALPNITLYADTQEMADIVEAELSFRMRTWPAFPCTFHTQSDLHALPRLPLHNPPRVVCPSNMNTAKGYDLFIALVNNETQLVAHTCEFVLRQVAVASTDPALDALVTQLEGKATIVDGILSAEAYRQLILDADVVVLPYRRPDFAFRSSAALSDAFLFGKPVVTTAQTWLGKHVQRTGIGAVFQDGDVGDMGRAIDQVLDRYTEYQDKIFAARQDWLAEHSADRLVAELCKVSSMNAPGLVGVYGRAAHAQLDETGVVAELVRGGPARGIMLDVGAHRGASLTPFVKQGWQVVAFEPDRANRAVLAQRFGQHPQVVIDARAVSDQVAAGVAFYTSAESTGISGLAAFTAGHEATGVVATTTIREVMRERGLERIDFLKIDTEGYDLMVLKGVPWEAVQPRVVVCEFEDRKTVPLGYRYEELAEFLVARGYRVLVSEWHPILRYGIRHDWRRLAVYPCELGSQAAWGNLVAFREAPDLGQVAAVVQRLVQTAPEAVAVSTPLQEGKSPARSGQQKESNMQTLDLQAEQSVGFPMARRLYGLLRRSLGFYLRWPGLLAAVALGLNTLAMMDSPFDWAFMGVGTSLLLFLLGHAATAYQQTASDALAAALRASTTATSALSAVRTGAGDQVLDRLDKTNEMVKRSLAAAQTASEGAETAIGVANRTKDAGEKLSDRVDIAADMAQRAVAAAQKASEKIGAITEVTNSVAETAEAALDGVDKATEIAQRAASIARIASEGIGTISEIANKAAAEGKRALDQASQAAERNGATLAMAQTASETAGTALAKSHTATGTALEALTLARKSSEETSVVGEVAHTAVETVSKAVEGSKKAEKTANTALDVYERLVQKSNILNAQHFHSFSRHLSDQDLERLLDFWAPALDLKLEKRSLGYLAHRICLVEDTCSGRLATTVQDALLRVLLAQSVKGEQLSVLEIGVLFGVNLALLFEACHGSFQDIHLTAIDPLEGYYQEKRADIITNVPICQAVFDHNMRRMAVSKDDLTVIPLLSTDKMALEKARERKYHLLIIDGDHSYTGVKFDFDHYAPLVQQNGYIVFDDYDTLDWPEVGTFVDTEVRSRSGVQFIGADWRTAVFRVVQAEQKDS